MPHCLRQKFHWALRLPTFPPPELRHRYAIHGDSAKTASPIGINPPRDKSYSTAMFSQDRPAM
jgi:hypothetical protein